MEFNEKLQQLRKREGLTQEQLAEALHVSRTAISKWESGRGLPGIDSLKAISKYFSVSLDDLLSGDALLGIAERESRAREKRLYERIYGFLDCAVFLLLILPLFASRIDGAIQEGSLLSLTSMSAYQKEFYWSFVVLELAMGAMLLFPKCGAAEKLKKKCDFGALSLLASACGTFLFVATRQPYAAAFTLIFLVIKALMHPKCARYDSYRP